MRRRSRKNQIKNYLWSAVALVVFIIASVTTFGILNYESVTTPNLQLRNDPEAILAIKNEASPFFESLPTEFNSTEYTLDQIENPIEEIRALEEARLALDPYTVHLYSKIRIRYGEFRLRQENDIHTSEKRVYFTNETESVWERELWAPTLGYVYEPHQSVSEIINNPALSMSHMQRPEGIRTTANQQESTPELFSDWYAGILGYAYPPLDSEQTTFFNVTNEPSWLVLEYRHPIWESNLIGDELISRAWIDRERGYSWFHYEQQAETMTSPPRSPGLSPDQKTHHQYWHTWDHETIDGVWVPQRGIQKRFDRRGTETTQREFALKDLVPVTDEMNSPAELFQTLFAAAQENELQRIQQNTNRYAENKTELQLRQETLDAIPPMPKRHDVSQYTLIPMQEGLQELADALIHRDRDLIALEFSTLQVKYFRNPDNLNPGLTTLEQAIHYTYSSVRSPRDPSSERTPNLIFRTGVTPYLPLPTDTNQQFFGHNARFILLEEPIRVDSETHELIFGEGTPYTENQLSPIHHLGGGLSFEYDTLSPGGIRGRAFTVEGHPNLRVLQLEYWRTNYPSRPNSKDLHHVQTYWIDMDKGAAWFFNQRKTTAKDYHSAIQQNEVHLMNFTQQEGIWVPEQQLWKHYHSDTRINRTIILDVTKTETLRQD